MWPLIDDDIAFAMIAWRGSESRSETTWQAQSAHRPFPTTNFSFPLTKMPAPRSRRFLPVAVIPARDLHLDSGAIIAPWRQHLVRIAFRCSDWTRRLGPADCPVDTLTLAKAGSLQARLFKSCMQALSFVTTPHHQHLGVGPTQIKTDCLRRKSGNCFQSVSSLSLHIAPCPHRLKRPRPTPSEAR